MLDEVVDPGGLRGGGSADAQLRADSLDALGGVIVELEVGGLFGLAGPEVDVGLVPDFEVPLRHFVDAVAVDQVLGELRRSRSSHLAQSLGGETFCLYQKACRRRVGGQLFRHEAQLDEGPDAVCEQAVVDLIDVGEVVNRIALRVFVVDADLVVKDGVEADVLEVGGLLSRRAGRGGSSRAGVRLARPEPNICSQKWGSGWAGAAAVDGRFGPAASGASRVGIGPGNTRSLGFARDDRV